jgi:ParB family chromosome partitioning protein
LRRLAKAGRIDAKQPVPCFVLDEADNPTEISLAENAIRTDMHPDDQCEAFADLIAGGLPCEDVAARFGVTPAVVAQRLKLAAVSPVLRKRFRARQLTLAQMMAFALVDDHTAQERVFNELAEWNRTPDSIRRCLVQDGISASHRLARFVGLDDYAAAGGVVLHDLFEADEPAVLADAALLEKLATAKLEAMAAHVKAEGWAWVKPELQTDWGTAYDRVYPQAGEDGEDAMFAPDDLARAGARVILEHDGTLTVDRGLVTPAKAGRKAELADTLPRVPTYPDSIVADLTAHRTAALRVELSNHTGVALATLVHALGLALLYPGYARERSCLTLSVKCEAVERHIRTPDEGTATARLEAVVEEWKVALPEDPKRLWDWCLTTEPDRLLELLALLTALTLDAVRNPHEAAAAPRLAQADRVAEAVNLDMTQHWRGKAEGFFGRLTKGLMVHLLTEAGDLAQADAVSRAKKEEGSSRTAMALIPTGWLPAPMLPTRPTTEAVQANEPDERPDSEE